MNPFLDTQEYGVEFSDCSYHELTAEKIEGSMLSNIDDEGRNFQLLSDMTDHKSDGNVISISDGFIKSINGNNLPNNTTSGWELQV